MEKTLVLVKPDAFKAGHTGDIIKIYEGAGLRLLAVRIEAVVSQHATLNLAEPTPLRSP